MKHVIIGASAAGLNAAKTIRELKPQDEIVVISIDTKVHSRCMLHKFLSGERTVESLDFMPENFFAANNITWMSGRKVEKVDTKANALTLDDKSVVNYDKLLIATGASFVIPPIGALKTASNVYGFRDLCDAELLDKVAKKGATCVAVGSGLVGLDAAHALCERGVKCSIVEMENRISPLQLDETAAKPYQALFEKAGCTFYLSEKAAGTKEENGKITALQLASGKELPCDFVLVSAGVRPNIAFLEGSGIETERAIKVDECLRTNIENVWAAGDVAGITGVWPNAVHQGKTAAQNMCGNKTPYEDRYGMKNTMNFYGLTTLSLGSNRPVEGEEVLVKESATSYKKLIIRDGKIGYVLMQGDISNTGFWQEIVKRQIPVSGIKKSLFDLSYADFFNVEEKTGLYKWA